MTFDLWPHDPRIYSVHWLCKIHTWSKFGRNPSICSNDNAITSYFCIHYELHDLWPWPHDPSKSNQFIGSASKIHDLSLAGIHQSVLEITWSRAVFAYIMSPVTFDLMSPKSNQFIGSARYIHDQSLAGIHQSVLQITRSRAVFAYIMSHVTFDLWPCDPKI